MPGGHIAWTVVRKASRAVWDDLFQAGPETYEFQPAMFHCNSLIVVVVSVGATHYGNRSVLLNGEAYLNVYDPGFAVRARTVFDRDLERAQCITDAAFKSRLWQERLLGHASALLSSQFGCARRSYQENAVIAAVC